VELSFAGIVFLRGGRQWMRNLDRTIDTWGVGAGLLPGNPWNLAYGASVSYGNTDGGILAPDRLGQISVSVWAAI
jgi:hypothetical protein